MTIKEAISKTSELADSFVGYREEINNGNIFARDPEIMKAYGGSIDNLPWCDIFYDFLFCHLFGADLGKRMTYQTTDMSAACRRSADNYKQNGAWFTIPQEGDQVFFYASGDINHTGYVRSVNGSTFATVEGNTSDKVGRRSYSLNDNTVAGFGRPDWKLAETLGEESDVDEDINVPDSSAEMEKQIINIAGTLYAKIFGGKKKPAEPDSSTAYLHLEKGDGMNDPEQRVKILQLLLNLHGYGPELEADGEFGNLTEAAVHNFQLERGLDANGVVDQLVWEELIKFDTEL